MIVLAVADRANDERLWEARTFCAISKCIIRQFERGFHLRELCHYERIVSNSGSSKHASHRDRRLMVDSIRRGAQKSGP